MSLVLPQLQLAQPERRERQELSPGRAASQALQAPLALWVSRVRLELLEPQSLDRQALQSLELLAVAPPV